MQGQQIPADSGAMEPGMSYGNYGEMAPADGPAQTVAPAQNLEMFGPSGYDQLEF